jgi:hypothetical protein
VSSQVQESGADPEADGAEAAEVPTDAAAAPALPLEQVFDVLKNERRRLVLNHLADRESEVPIGELAEHVAAHENDKPVQQLSSDERKRAYVGLYQCHLPKMDAMEIVRFNKSRGRIELGPNYPEVEPYVDADLPPQQEPERWSRRYLAATTVAAVGLVGASIQGAGLVGLSATITVVAFGVLSLAHWWTTPRPGADDD